MLSLVMALTGLFTGFNINVEEDKLWTPRGCRAEVDQAWLNEDSGFEEEPRFMILMFHFDGKNVLGQDQVKRMFEVVDGIRAVDGYDEMCAMSEYVDDNGVNNCRLDGVVNFWNASSAIFEKQVSSDEDAIEQMSALQFPDLFPVAEQVFFGFAERDENGLLTSVVSYSIFFHFPHVDSAEDVEKKALDFLLDIQDVWRDDPDTTIYVEGAAERSFADEFTRAILVDLPLGKFSMKNSFAWIGRTGSNFFFKLSWFF
jgi:hypothetical protein